MKELLQLGAIKPNFPIRRQWWLRFHNGVTPCASCGFFDSLKAAQCPPADNQITKAIIHVREVP